MTESTDAVTLTVPDLEVALNITLILEATSRIARYDEVGPFPPGAEGDFAFARLTDEEIDAALNML